MITVINTQEVRKISLQQPKVINTKTNNHYLQNLNGDEFNMRNFILRNEDGTERGIFTGKQPRQAALKVANRSIGTKDAPVTIMLRERGTKKVHIFLAWKELVDAPAKRPDWLPAKIFKPFVKKERIETLA